MNVSAEVAGALAQSGLPLEAQVCLGALAAGEGGRSFLTLYGDSPNHPRLWSGPLDHFPTHAEWPGSTGPTGQPTSALGFLQFERATYAECAAATGLAGIDPQSQIANGWWLAQHDYAKRSGGGSLLAALQNDRLDEIASALRSTWPGGADIRFPSRYAAFMATMANPVPSPPMPLPSPPTGDPVDTALAVLASAIDHMRTNVSLAVARIGAPNPATQTIIATLADLTAGVTSLSDSLEHALAQGQSAGSF